jgi:hypothetical protein
MLDPSLSAQHLQGAAHGGRADLEVVHQIRLTGHIRSRRPPARHDAGADLVGELPVQGPAGVRVQGHDVTLRVVRFP